MAGEGCFVNHAFTAFEQNEKKDTDVGKEDYSEAGSVTKKTKQKTFLGKLQSSVLLKRRGIPIAAFAALLFSVKNLFISYISMTVDPFQAVAMVMPVMMVGSLIVLAVKRIPPPKTAKKHIWLLCGGVSWSLSLLLLTFAVTYIDVADVITIVYTSLIFVGFLSWIILKEKLYMFDFVFSMISFAGVICISRPHFLFGSDQTTTETKNLLIGICVAIGCAFSNSVGYTVMRKLSQLDVHTFVAVLWIGVVGVLTNAVTCTVLDRWQLPNMSEWLYAIFAGVSYFLAQVTMVLALSCETATFVNIVLTIEIACTFLLQFFFLHVTPFWTSYIGAVLIITACIGITIKKRPEERQEEDVTA